MLRGTGISRPGRPAARQARLLGLPQRLRLWISAARLLCHRFRLAGLLCAAGQKQGTERRKSNRSFHAALPSLFF